MDLSLPLIGVLGLVGYNINRTSTSREYIDKRVKIPLSELGQGKSIYEARTFTRTPQEEKVRYEKIRANNDLISFNNKSDLKTVNGLKPNKKVKFNGVIDDKEQEEIQKNKIYSGPMFSLKKFFIPETQSKEFKKEGFENENSELSGKSFEKTHQNMVPFFGGKVKNGGSTGQLSRYIGEDKPKKEAVLAQKTGKQQINGSVAFTTLVEKDRFVTPDNQATLLPFEQVRVLPIRAEDNRPTYKTTDQLNVNNTRIALEGRLNGGKTIAQRPILGIVEKNTVDTFYETGENKYFTTVVTGGDGYYKGSTQEDRTLRKNIIAESTFNQNPGFDPNRMEPIRASKTDDGKNTVVQQDKRGSFQNDWVRGQKSTNTYDDNVYKNISLREQERETSNTVQLQSGFDKNAGHRQRVQDNLKTTNKELSLYSYKGSFNSNGLNLPSKRDSFYTNESKTKPTSSYIPGGSKKFAPGAGSSSYNYESKKNPVVENYVGNYKGTVQQSHDIGSVSKSRLLSAEHDFSDRNALRVSKQKFI